MSLPEPLRRLTAALLLVTFTSLVLTPAQADQAAPVPQAGSGDDYAQVLDAMKTTARQARQQTQADGWLDRLLRLVHLGFGDAPAVAALRTQGQRLDALEAEALDGFAATEAFLKEKNLPGEILGRHRQAVAEFDARRAELKRLLHGLEDAETQGDADARESAANALAGFLEAHQKGKAHTPADPNNLPFHVPDGQIRAPKESVQEYQSTLFKPEPVRLAALGDPAGLALPAAPGPLPGPDDLAETEDVQITPAIRAQAAALRHNPVAIHNWVRNTIEFIPTYGSVQGADLTLQTRRGNAFDTASLLIALLRASGVPARYAYGTVQIPAEQAMDWVGGVQTPEAAQQLLGQGGIPNTGLVSGGRVVAIKLEHVWAEAYVDYVPSRGAVNRQGDTWVPLDASFKQHQHTPGMDLKTAVPLDAQSLVGQIQAGATINEAEGWAQNLNGTALQTALADYQTRLKTYIDGQNPNATVGDVLGSRTIIPQDLPVLAGTLPYQTLAVGGRFAGLPDSLRGKYRFTLYTGADSNPLGGGIQRGGEVFTYTASLPKIAGGKLTLSFVPATQADADLVNSYLPQPHPDGSPIQPGELPTSLPGYLVHLKAEYRLDGQLVASGGDFAMGSAYVGSSALYSPDRGWEEAADNVQTAGEYWATYAGATVSQGRLDALKAKLEATRARLGQFQANPADTAPVAGLGKEDLAGDLLYGTILGYFAANEASLRVEQRAAGAVAHRKSGFGHFGVSAKVQYFYGIPRQVSFPGLAMDIDHWRDTTVMKDNDAQRKIAFVRQAGTRLSAYEHLVPEKFWTDAQHPGEAVSAVKALARAAAEGQKVYTLTGRNASSLQQIQVDDAIRAEIQDALNAGKAVTVHERPITVSGWTGTGYVIADPDTGAGAYKISGGANGAILYIAANFFAIMTLIFMTMVGLPGVGVFIGIIITSMVWFSFLGFLSVIAILFLRDDNARFDRTAFIDWGGFTLAALTISAAILAGTGVGAALLGLIISIAAGLNDFPWL